MSSSFPLTIIVPEPFPIAYVVVRTTVAHLASERPRGAELLERALSDAGMAAVGPRISMFRTLGADGAVEAAFGVRVPESFQEMGALRCRRTPAGRAVTTATTNSAAGVSAANTAVLEWAAEVGADLAGVSWEVTVADDKVEVFHLLAVEPSVIDYELG